MAISDDLPGVEVAITVGGNDLREYHDNELDEDDRTTTRYIEAASGQTFAIRIKVPLGFKFAADTLTFYVYMDGVYVEGTAVFKTACTLTDCKSGIYGWSTSSNQTLRRFRFDAVETVNDGRMHKDEEARVKDLGTIMVKVEQHERVSTNAFSPGSLGIQELGMVSEKALKGQAVSHSVGLAEPERCVGGARWSVCRAPGYEDPVAVFVFKYRSRESLKAERIVPRTPTPPPLEDRDISTLNAAELKELQKRARAFRDEQEAKIKIKREKLEQSRRRKVARPNANSTILEVDDDGAVRQGSTPTVASDDEGPIVLD